MTNVIKLNVQREAAVANIAGATSGRFSGRRRTYGQTACSTPSADKL